jgi:PncC family amidohydrolase
MLCTLLDGHRVATAESVTAGRIASRLADLPRATSVFVGGLVAYDTETKRSLLGVTAPLIYSFVAAQQMAAGAARLLHADIGIASTGVAGRPQEGVPQGVVFIGWSMNGATAARRYRFFGTPTDICEQATEQAIDDLARVLETMGAPETSSGHARSLAGLLDEGRP